MMLEELIRGLGILAAYFAVLATAALTMRFFVKIPNEPFRKLLHMILLGSLFVWTFVFDTWYLAAGSAIAFALLVYPCLKLAEKIKGYSSFVTERKGGELKQSLLVVFFMFALVTAVCRGIFSDKFLVITSISAWGFGDAAAALIGKRYGKHAIEGRHIEGKKSAEGTFAMFAVSFLSVFILLMIRGGMSFIAYTVTALITGAVSAYIELYSLHGSDTFNCPAAAMAVLIPLVHLFGGL